MPGSFQKHWAKTERKKYRPIDDDDDELLIENVLSKIAINFLSSQVTLGVLISFVEFSWSIQNEHKQTEPNQTTAKYHHQESYVNTHTHTVPFVVHKESYKIDKNQRNALVLHALCNVGLKQRLLFLLLYDFTFYCCFGWHAILFILFHPFIR